MLFSTRWKGFDMSGKSSVLLIRPRSRASSTPMVETVLSWDHCTKNKKHTGFPSAQERARLIVLGQTFEGYGVPCNPDEKELLRRIMVFMKSLFSEFHIWEEQERRCSHKPQKFQGFTHLEGILAERKNGEILCSTLLWNRISHRVLFLLFTFCPVVGTGHCRGCQDSEFFHSSRV